MVTLAKIADTFADRLLPRPMAASYQARKERRALAALERQQAYTDNLKSVDDVALSDWLGADFSRELAELDQLMSPIHFGGGSGAVNPGDRRALYHIARALEPRSMLEVGTHVGASTGRLAFALKQQERGGKPRPRLVSCDISDVNDPQTGAWKRIGCNHSPAQLVRALGCDDIVTFVCKPSIDYLNTCPEKFDLIFLDGDHSSSGVYQEIPAALRLLQPGGLILLHDYFPDGQPLWSDGAVVPGPQLAVQRLQAEGAAVAVIPLAALPWPTKLDSNVSSLAILCRSAAGRGA
jgi:predicted O-methyltransferase YrrM